jgi:excisionase family DNA binding protein
MDSKMITSSQLGAALGLTKSTILKMARAGQIPCIKMPTARGDYRFDIEAVRAVMTAEADKIVQK